MPQANAFDSTGDTAVMLRLLAVRGYKAVDKLRGMFAFALWDEARREMVIARDPLGIKPLYICRNPDTGEDRSWSLMFASEIRAILAAGIAAAAAARSGCRGVGGLEWLCDGPRHGRERDRTDLAGRSPGA